MFTRDSQLPYSFFHPSCGVVCLLHLKSCGIYSAQRILSQYNLLCKQTHITVCLLYYFMSITASLADQNKTSCTGNLALKYIITTSSSLHCGGHWGAPPAHRVSGAPHGLEAVCNFYLKVANSVNPISI